MAMLLCAAVTVAACGGGSHFANKPRPASPINVSVYINDQRVSVSPNAVSPGLVAITITNQSSSAQSIEVVPVGSNGGCSTAGHACTGPISPQANDQVTVDLSDGQYTVGIAPNSATEAAAATPTGVAPGLLTVQGKRSNSNNQLLQP
jgi:hypothetical protein